MYQIVRAIINTGKKGADNGDGCIERELKYSQM